MSNKTQFQNFIRHIDDKCPIPDMAKVVYRTAHNCERGKKISHIHAPMLASEIDWSHKPTIGRIYDYLVIAS